MIKSDWAPGLLLHSRIQSLIFLGKKTHLIVYNKNVTMILRLVATTKLNVCTNLTVLLAACAMMAMLEEELPVVAKVSFFPK